MKTQHYPSFVAVDSHAGIYAWQEFVSQYDIRGVDQEDLAILKSGPDNELYWEAASNVEDNGRVVVEGIEYRIEQDEDIWLYDSRYDYDEDRFGGITLSLGKRNVYLQPGDDANAFLDQAEDQPAHFVAYAIEPYFD